MVRSKSNGTSKPTLDDLVIDQQQEIKNLHNSFKTHQRLGLKFIAPVICELCGDIQPELPLGWSQFGRSKYGELVQAGLASWCPNCNAIGRRS